MIARHFLMTGRVQGVFFRRRTQEKAKELGMTGWVRNTEEGAVEVHAEGTEKQLQELEVWLWKGPDMAEVSQVIADEAEVMKYSDFFIPQKW